jgi:cyclase
VKTLVLVASLFAVTAAADVTTEFQTVQVADGVYAFIPPEPRSQLVNSNCVVVIGDDGVLVVDPGQFPSLSRRMLAQIRRWTENPVRYVVNTHWHWDHTLANSVYLEAYPHANVISTSFTRKALVEYTPPFLGFLRTSGSSMLANLQKRHETTEDSIARADLADDIADLESGLVHTAGTQLIAPNLTFEDTLSIHLGKREVRVFHPGRANTAGDALVFIPDAKVLISGDVVVAPTPYATSSYLTDWIAVMQTLQALDAAVIVPGHGPVLRDKTYLRSLEELFRAVTEQVGAAVAQGLTLEQTRARVDLERFRQRFAGTDRRRNRAFRVFFVEPAIAAAWKHARGESTSESPF